MNSAPNNKVLKPFLVTALCVLSVLLSMLWSITLQPRFTVDQSMALLTPPDVEPFDMTVLATPVASSLNRKLRFFSALKPLVVQENRYILQQRLWLQSLRDQLLQGRTMTRGELDVLMQLVALYQLPSEDTASVALISDMQRRQQIDALLLRVDVVPVDLVLVQAANESAWGRSRFAQQGNNLFGQWCFRAGCGLVPAQRNDGARHEVAVFSSPALSIRAYLHNLNTFHAYQTFRAQRAALRVSGVPDLLSGGNVTLQLAETLLAYSERGTDYIHELQQMLRTNRSLIEQAPEA